MIEMLRFEKETEGKIRWDAVVDDAKFELYIPKWRVPETWPSKIYVTIERENPLKKYRRSYIKIDYENSNSLRTNPIVSYVERFEEHTETLRYRPLGNSSEWEIGEPYIPYSLTYDCADRLKLTVEWNLE